MSCIHTMSSLRRRAFDRRMCGLRKFACLISLRRLCLGSELRRRRCELQGIAGRFRFRECEKPQCVTSDQLQHPERTARDPEFQDDSPVKQPQPHIVPALQLRPPRLRVLDLSSFAASVERFSNLQVFSQAWRNPGVTGPGMNYLYITSPLNDKMPSVSSVATSAQ